RRSEQAAPTREQAEAAERRHGAELAQAGEAHDVEAAREEQRAEPESPAGAAGQIPGNNIGDQSREADRERVGELVAGGRLPPLEAASRVGVGSEPALQAVRTEGTK